MRRFENPLVVVVGGLCLAVGFIFAALPAMAADSDREGRWRFNIPVTFVSSEKFDGEGGSSLDLAGDTSFGFGLGYNFDERWLVGFEITFMNMNYEALVPEDDDGDQNPDGSVRIAGSLDSSSLQAIGQYNFLEKTVTPFVRASVGLTYVDSNIPSGPANGVCWWHPWWGYICDTWQPTFDDTNFSYGAAVGIRGQLNDSLFLEASVNQLWIDYDKLDTPDFMGYRLNIGWLH